MKVKRGEIYYADLGDYKNSNIQAGIRPVLILQNDIGNVKSKTTIVAPITTKSKKPLPTHYTFFKHLKIQTVLLEQILTINKDILQFQIGELSSKDMLEIEKRIKVSLGI